MHIKDIIRRLRTLAHQADDIAEDVIGDADYRAPHIASVHLKILKDEIDKLLNDIGE